VQDPLKSVDAADRAQLIKAIVLFGAPAFVILGALWYFLAAKDIISPGLAAVLTLLDVPLAVLVAFGIHGAVGSGSAGFMNTIYSWGSGPPPAPSYPRQDTLIAQGQYANAAEYFRDHIRVTPEDLDARLRLAYLAEHHLKDDAEAERLYADVRKLATKRDHEFAAANGLIDLYRRLGRRDRLRVELARFAERYKGSAAGNAAAVELKDLKAADTPAAG
jgi:Arc/MetJ-type ribon-helix-helix transcriptional regulator